MNKNKKYIIGNWKSNKDIKEVREWFDRISSLITVKKTDFQALEIVICPSFVHFALAREMLKKYALPFKLGSQNVSPFSPGSYTGEINGTQLEEYVDFALVGHSERRSKFYEEDGMLEEKVKRLVEQGIEPVYCVEDDNSYIPKGVRLVAYEPVFAIGTGKAETPANANKVLSKILKKNSDVEIGIYGGSVDPENITSFLNQERIYGVLPGKASLQAEIFFEMIVNAAN